MRGEHREVTRPHLAIVEPGFVFDIARKQSAIAADAVGWFFHGSLNAAEFSERIGGVVDAVGEFEQGVDEAARVRAGGEQGAVLVDRAAGEADGFRRLRQREFGGGESFFAGGGIAGGGEDAIEAGRRLFETGENFCGHVPGLEGIAQFRRGPGGGFLRGIFRTENDGNAAGAFFGGKRAGKQFGGGQRGGRGGGGFKKMAARIFFHGPERGYGILVWLTMRRLDVSNQVHSASAVGLKNNAEGFEEVIPGGKCRIGCQRVKRGPRLKSEYKDTKRAMCQVELSGAHFWFLFPL